MGFKMFDRNRCTGLTLTEGNVAQAIGTVDGFPVYFRATRDTWWFGVGEHDEGNPVSVVLTGKYGQRWTGPVRKTARYESFVRRVLRGCIRRVARQQDDHLN